MSIYLAGLIYKCFKCLCLCLCRILGVIFHPIIRASHTILPVQNPSATPAPTIINGHDSSSLLQRLLISSPVSASAPLVVNEGRWIKHYSSRHWMLLLGEGDFSFSACLALAFGRASNMVATSLDSTAFLKQNYENAVSNIKELRRRGCKVMHGIDATKMANHELLGHLKFDRIIFNFPFAGFFKNLSRDAQLRRHRRLVSLFLKNAKEMIGENGEIHVTHKTNGFHAEWNLELVASSHRLQLVEAVPFDLRDYRGYHTKRGFGGDNDFNCNPSKTYKFALRC